MAISVAPSDSVHPMSAVDAAWYHMDGPANTAVVTSVALTRRPLDVARVRRLLQRRLLPFERFRQRVVARGLLYDSPAWEDVAVDLDAHLHHVTLPAPGGEAALRAFVERQASAPLDPGRPLWQMHVVDNVGTGSALVLRYHHCIGDGSAMMAVAARLFEMPTQAAPSRTARAARETAAPRLVDQAAMLIGEAGAVVADLLKWPDPASPIKGEYHARKRVAWSAPVSLDAVKAIGAPLGAKVNDVLVAAITGALRGYLRRRGAAVEGTTLRAMVPVDLRAPERFGELGNEFGLMILELPVAEPTPSARLASTKERMDALKRSAEGPAMRQLLDLFGRGPKVLEDLACEIFGSKSSLVLTNVAGPGAAIRLAGETVERMMFCVPHPGRQIGMGISIFSYRRTVTVTVIADARLVPHPEAITRAFEREIAALGRRAAGAPAQRGSTMRTVSRSSGSATRSKPS
jgi:WS/DGAT/MGAT family acyltransferase